MPGSYLTINYSLRPAKGVERRMLAEAFRRLEAIAPVNSYRYVGFGSPFFEDFRLFHRILGMHRMVNIEEASGDAGRFRFNRPFGCVRLEFGHSTDVLDRIRGWSRRTILWLDYEGRLDSTVLEDLRIFATNARSCSVFVVTVNAQPLEGRNNEETDSKRLDEAGRLVGRAPQALGIGGQTLGGSGTAKFFRKLMIARLEETLNARNSGLALDDPRRIVFRQLFFFTYADSTAMMSLGGVVCENRDLPKLESCGLDTDHLDFIRTGDVPCDIAVPPLTTHEVHHLNSQLPLRAQRVLRGRGIPAGHLKRFSDIYRYYPTYVLAEI